MSLQTRNPAYGDYPLYGIDEISLPKNATLIFSHPAVKKGNKPRPLYIYSGATAIQWNYNLNTSVTPTIGGEVVQILSCTAGPMTITGQTAGLSVSQDGSLPKKNQRIGYRQADGKEAYTPQHELYEIVSWFREYMEQAGSNTYGNLRRDERAILFKYPERGWRFWIQVTSIKGFRYDQQVVAPQWSITAEMVTDNALEFFEGSTMSSFTDNLLSNTNLLGTLGLSAFAASGTETTNGAFGNTGDGNGTVGSTDPFLNPFFSTSLVSSSDVGNNFQNLVSAWSSGDTNFLNGVFSALADNSSNPQNVDSMYSKLFGGTYLGEPTTTGSGGGSASGSVTIGASSKTVVSSATQSALALGISQAFQAAGIPGYLAVADALVESGLNPDSRNPNDGGAGIDGVGLFQVHAPGGASNSSYALTASSGAGRSQEVTSTYPVNQQVADAVQWWSATVRSTGIDFSTATDVQLGQFAAAAQNPQGKDAYAAAVTAKLAQAKQLVANQAIAATTGTSTSTSFIYYDQGDPRWATHPIYQPGDTIGPDGCGVTSAAMVIANLKDSSVTPIQTGDYMTQNGGYVAGEGASVSGLEAVCEHYGLTTQLLSSFSDAASWISAGGLVISGGHGDPIGTPPYVSAGHVVVFRAVASNGNIIVANPAGNFPNPSTGFAPPIAGMQYMIGVKT